MIVPAWLWIVAGLVTASGLVLLTWSMRGDRARGRKRCPKCWYQMQGVQGTRCPECGHETMRERDLLKPRRRWRFAAFALVPLAALPALLITRQFRQHGWFWLLPRYKVVGETQVAGWRAIRLDPRNPDDFEAGRLLRLQRAGKPTFELQGWMLDLGEVSAPDRNAPRVGVGQDITGDGVPDLIVSDYSGGAHCCTTYHILSLGPDAVVELQAIDTQNSGANFHDVDGDGLPEMHTADNSFAYWNAPYVSSPMPGVILKWRNGGFEVAHELMRADAPSESELAGTAKAIRESDQWPKDGFTPPVDLWAQMLDLIYTGHADLAWQMLRDAWPTDRPGREAFMVDFIAQLGRSPYWEGVRKINVPQGMPGAGMAMP